MTHKEVIHKAYKKDMDPLEAAFFELRKQIHEGKYWVERIHIYGHGQIGSLRLKYNGNDHVTLTADKHGVRVECE